jgi:hypothetical protein
MRTAITSPLNLSDEEAVAVVTAITLLTAAVRTEDVEPVGTPAWRFSGRRFDLPRRF